MKYHLCVEIDGEMERIIRTGRTVLGNGNCQEAFAELSRAQKEGKTLYSGCQNMTKEGRCGGHKNKKKD